MDVRAGYKQTEVGVIPEKWDLVTLGQLFSFKNGLNKAKKFFGYGTPIVNYMDVFSFAGLRISDVQGRVDVNKNELKAYEVRKGDVFFTRTSETVEEVGIASVMLDETLDTVFSGFVLRARPKDDSLAVEFKKYCFSAKYFRQQVTARASYTTRALTNGRSLSASLFTRPPLPEQCAIAAALSDVDALLTKLDQLIAKKRDLKQAAMQQLLTGKRRLPGFSGEWEVKRLGEVSILRNGYAFKSSTYSGLGKYSVVTIANVQDGYMDISECSKIVTLPQDLQNHHKLQRGDILISMTGNVGRVCRVTVEDCLLNQRVGKIIPSSIECSLLFLLLNQRKFLVTMAGKAKGGAQGNISVSDITEYEFSVPSSFSEQTAIAAVLSDMDAEIAALEARRDKTRALKQAMMQELLTGRIRLL